MCSGYASVPHHGREVATCNSSGGEPEPAPSSVRLLNSSCQLYAKYPIIATWCTVAFSYMYMNIYSSQLQAESITDALTSKI